MPHQSKYGPCSANILESILMMKILTLIVLKLKTN